MSAGKYNIKLEIGATYSKLFTWKDENSTRVDLTGCTARMQILDREGGNVLLTLTTENGRLRLEDDQDSESLTQGVVRILIEANATNDIRKTEGVYDLKIYFPGSPVFEHRFLRGTVTFIAARTTDTI